MSLFTHSITFAFVAIHAATAMFALLSCALAEIRARPFAAEPEAEMFRPVLVHDRGRQKLIRSGRLSRASAPKIRLVYNGG